jgi:hypothetical protein
MKRGILGNTRTEKLLVPSIYFPALLRCNPGFGLHDENTFKMIVTDTGRQQSRDTKETMSKQEVPRPS